MSFEKRKDGKLGFYFYSEKPHFNMCVNGEIWLFSLELGKLFSVTIWEKEL
jgi:hypothetical protein